MAITANTPAVSSAAPGLNVICTNSLPDEVDALGSTPAASPLGHDGTLLPVTCIGNRTFREFAYSQ
jgi:hypothetical protein